jgi:hypothetical protein
MMQIFIENYELDVSASLSALLTFSLDDVKNFSDRDTTFSKTIVLPGTSNNNKIFGHIYNIGSSNRLYNSSEPNANYNFNASVSAPCTIFNDNLQAFKGVLRLLSIVIDKGHIEYEVAVFGTMTGLISKLSGALIEDLDFSAYDHTFNYANILASWSATAGTSYYYPLIDYGGYSNSASDKSDWQVLTFRPALHVREYLDKIFTNAGFTWKSDLFDSARFKNLIVPLNTKVLQRSDSTLLAMTNTATVTQISTGDTDRNFDFDTTVSNSGFTVSSGVNGGQRFTYTGAVTATMNFDYVMSGYRWSTDANYAFTIQKNGVTVASESTGINSNRSTTPIPWLWYNHNFSITLATGDYIDFIVTANPTTGTYLLDLRGSSLTVTVDNPILVDVTYGTSVVMNDTIPKNIKQIDFLRSVVKLFNLYVYEKKQLSAEFASSSTFDLYIEPYIDFYSADSTNAVDWTLKVDRSKALMIKPMAELNAKIYAFKYKQDGDFYNDLYQKKYNAGYGDYIFDSGQDFVDSEADFELIFAASPLVGYAGEDKVFTTIFKLTNGVEEHIDSNIRILQRKRVTGVAAYDIKNIAAVLGSPTEYGYAGHLDDPDAPDNDLNFGVPYELFFTIVAGNLSNTQFNLYWSSYMAEITDKDSRLLSCNVYLNTADIINLNFSKYVNIDGVLFRLNKIVDWNVSKPMVCKAEFIRVIQTIY